MNCYSVKVRYVPRWLGGVIKKPRRRSVVIECNRAAPAIKSTRLTSMLDLALKSRGGGSDLVNILLREGAARVAAPTKSTRTTGPGGRSRKTTRTNVDNVLVR